MYGTTQRSPFNLRTDAGMKDAARLIMEHWDTLPEQVRALLTPLSRGERGSFSRERRMDPHRYLLMILDHKFEFLHHHGRHLTETQREIARYYWIDGLSIRRIVQDVGDHTNSQVRRGYGELMAIYSFWMSMKGYNETR